MSYEDVGASIVLFAAVLTALGVIIKKTINFVKVLDKKGRQALAEQITEVMVSHPRFVNVEDSVNRIEQELQANGGTTVKDKVNSTYSQVGELSLRLGNVEQQLEGVALNSMENAKKGGRRITDHPSDVDDTDSES